eukprot:2587980-Pyramimonas_sp.AAC.1
MVTVPAKEANGESESGRGQKKGMDVDSVGVDDRKGRGGDDQQRAQEEREQEERAERAERSSKGKGLEIVEQAEWE